jgi:hypothetical protein
MERKGLLMKSIHYSTVTSTLSKTDCAWEPDKFCLCGPGAGGRSPRPGGTIMLGQSFANDRIEDKMNPVGQLYYTAHA